jgi:hypothetical protein
MQKLMILDAEKGMDVNHVASEQNEECVWTNMVRLLISDYGKDSRRKRCEKKF